MALVAYSIAVRLDNGELYGGQHRDIAELAALNQHTILV
jgi:hypothetical protein